MSEEPCLSPSEKRWGWVHFILLLPRDHSPVEKGQKWPRGRSQVCPKCFWDVYLISVDYYYFTGTTCHPNILRNCNKSLDILNFYLLPPVCWTLWTQCKKSVSQILYILVLCGMGPPCITVTIYHTFDHMLKCKKAILWKLLIGISKLWDTLFSSMVSRK